MVVGAKKPARGGLVWGDGPLAKGWTNPRRDLSRHPSHQRAGLPSPRPMRCSRPGAPGSSGLVQWGKGRSLARSSHAARWCDGRWWSVLDLRHEGKVARPQTWPGLPRAHGSRCWRISLRIHHRVDRLEWARTPNSLLPPAGLRDGPGSGPGHHSLVWCPDFVSPLRTRERGRMVSQVGPNSLRVRAASARACSSRSRAKAMRCMSFR